MSGQGPEPHHLTRAVAAAQELRLVSALVVLLGVGVFLALPFVLSSGAVVFLPVVAAAMLSIVVAPLADKLTLLRLPNMLASLFALITVVALFAALLMLILQPALDTFDQLPALMKRVSARLAELRGSLGWAADLDRQIDRLAGHGSSREVRLANPTVIEQLAFATPTVVFELLLTLLMCFFMVESRVRMRRTLVHSRTHGTAGLKTAKMIREVQDLVSGYILTVGAINLGIGTVVALGAWALDFSYPVMWGGIAALLNFLPYVGPLIMAAVLALVGVGTSESLLAGLLAPALYLGLHAVESNVVTPAVLGARFTLNPVLILVSISYFSWIWGVTGALLSVPILLTLTALFHHTGRPNLLGFLFGEPLFPPAEADQSAPSTP
jgi:predicted PurR-regulated permease PerM